jgi:hypothetical protein
LKLARAAELDCEPSDDVVLPERRTAVDTWPIGESSFSIEISGHELVAKIPSTKSSVSDPNEVDESEYDNASDASSYPDEEGEEEEEDDNELDYDEDREYEDDYQYTRGDFDEEEADLEEKMEKCLVHDPSDVPQSSDVIENQPSNR